MSDILQFVLFLLASAHLSRKRIVLTRTLDDVGVLFKDLGQRLRQR
jgi:hypothetical protein